jgi:DNA-binding LacI/PurR family transcriptional regulator
MPEMVKAACDRLLRIIEERPIDGPHRLVIPTELRVRGSSQRMEAA